MNPTAISSAIIVKDTEPARVFYTTHFDARITFDCGWYVNFEFGPKGPTLQFMQPQAPEHKEFQGGLTYNLQFDSVAEVEQMHSNITDAGLPIIMPLEDHPWGDRGFATLDPYGVAIYIYVDTEPDESFKQYYKD